MSTNKRLLLLSNSTNYGQSYLEHAIPEIKNFLGRDIQRVLFFPYAGVTISWDQFASTVRSRFQGMGYEVDSIHESKDPLEAIRNAQAIAVGGGNTCHLLYHLYKANVMDDICEVVKKGVPYLGWSAGSNVACPTIKTTNDMPIICPPHLEALNLVPFQINPHYLDANPEFHQGETREQRLLEFIKVNPNIYVVGLREGTLLRIEGAKVKLIGDRPARIFRSLEEPVEYNSQSSFDFLLQ